MNVNVDKQLTDFMWGKNTNKGITTWLWSQATQKTQPSKMLNSGSASIPWADPNVPSKNNATRRSEYAIDKGNPQDYVNSLPNNQRSKLWEEVQQMRNQGKPESEIHSYLNQLAQWLNPQNNNNPVGNVNPTGSFASYQTNYTYGNDSVMDEQMAKYNQANTKNETALAGLLLETDALKSKSSNVNDVRNLVNEVTQAYRKGIYDTNTIAKQLWVDPNYVKLVQQGKAWELVNLSDDFKAKMMKWYDWQREDYDIAQKRVEEDYTLAMQRLEAQYSSAMQTLHRNMFDKGWESNVGNAVVWASWSQYAYDSIKAKHEQAVNDAKNEYNFASQESKMAITRATQDYTKNIERLNYQYGEKMKEIQTSVLSQFQQIDSKIGLTVEQMANSYGALLSNVATAKNKIVWDYIKALWSGQEEYARQISRLWGLWLDPNSHNFTDKDLWRTWSAVKQKDWTTKRVANINIPNATNNFGDIIYKAWANEVWRVGSYTSQKGRTYNVYWTRADGYNAAKALLKRAYYGMTIGNAIGKWINWNGTAPGRAAGIAQANGLSLSEVLSDSNVDKLLLSMGQWEWTLRPGQTIEQWIAEGEDYSSYASKSMSSWGIDTGAWLTAEQQALASSIIVQKMGKGILWSKTDEAMRKKSLVYQMIREWKTAEEILKAFDTQKISSSLWDKTWYMNGANAVSASMTKSNRENFLNLIESYAEQGNNDLITEAILDNSIKGNDKIKAKTWLVESSRYYDQLKRDLKELKDTWYDTNILNGKLEDMELKIGKIRNEKARLIASNIKNNFNAYKNMISGTAVSDKEAADLQSGLASISNEFNTNMAIIEGNEAYIDNKFRSLYQSSIGNAQYNELMDEYRKQTGNNYDHRQAAIWGTTNTVNMWKKKQNIIQTGKSVLKFFWYDIDDLSSQIATKTNINSGYSSPFANTPWRNITSGSRKWN